jgi:hypothetical protein
MREKLIDNVHSELMGLLQRTPYIRCEDVNRQYAVNWLMNNGVTVQKWIPVTERLPEGAELVLIHCKNGAMFVGYCGKQYCDYERRWRIKTALNSTKLLNLGRVTHWMPLPQPPKED